MHPRINANFISCCEEQCIPLILPDCAELILFAFCCSLRKRGKQRKKEFHIHHVST